MFVFAPAAQSVVPVLDEKDVYFPVHRIYCVGRNYAEHDLEMGGTGKPEPCFFAKPADAVHPIGPKETGEVPYASATDNLQHEVELVIAIGKAGSDIPVQEAMDYVWGWAVGIDLTRRDLQNKAKAAGKPWTTGKSFDHSAPITHIRPKHRAPDMDAADVWLYVNNVEKQKGNTRTMILTIPELIHEASRYWRLMPGDLIFTGSPSGVSKIVPGDVIRAGVGGVGTLEFKIV